jgi:hypothetical protein
LGFQLTREHVRAQTSASAMHAQSVSLQDRAAGLYWLGPFTERSPALVLSLDCPACLDLLAALTEYSFEDALAGPAIYFKTTDANRELTETFVAAVLSQPALPRDAFLATAAVLLARKDAVFSAPANAARQLAAVFPDAANRESAAVRILADHASVLSVSLPNATTPLLLPREGAPRIFFKIEELFPR